MLNLIPKPKSFITFNGYFKKIESFVINTDFKESIALKFIFNKLFKSYKIDKSPGQIKLIKDELINDGFKIIIKDNVILLNAKDEQNIFYALVTLKQIFDQTDDLIPNLELTDYPDLKVRGIMLDISRSKVPKLSTLKTLVEMFAQLKYNHLELYVEGFSYEYPSFKQYLNDLNFLPLKDYLELESYCNEFYIDFVPNQNGLGHMTDWLQLDEFKDLAECPDGFYIWGAKRPPSTLNPLDQRSLDLVKKMYDDMLPYFKSSYFNMNLDEPFEIGAGKSAIEVAKLGVGRVYVNYLNKLCEHVKTYHKTPMLWGDVLIKHQEEIENLDKSCIFIDWGYHQGYDFDAHASLLEQKQINYLLAPGTSSWGSITGRYVDMYGSIDHATKSSKLHHGQGILLTDWGDIGHLQYLPISYLGFILGSLKTWGDVTEDEFKSYAKYFLDDDSLVEALIILANYHLLESTQTDYGSRLFSAILWSEHASRYDDNVEYFLKSIKPSLLTEQSLQAISIQLTKAKALIKDIKDILISKELSLSIYLIEILIEVNRALSQYVNTTQDIKDTLNELIDKLTKYSEEHKILWDERNIHAGYKFSNQRIEWLKCILKCLIERR